MEGMPKQTAEATEDSEVDVAALEERVMELREAVSEQHEAIKTYEGQNLTGALLEEADSVAKSLMEAEQELQDAEQAVRQARSAMPAEPPEAYQGVAHLVSDTEKQSLSRTASDNRPPNAIAA